MSNYINDSAKKTSYYGLIKVTDSKKYLYFIPLILIVSVNLWNGININNSIIEIVFHILNMINIGFIEEIIFRGFLFKYITLIIGTIIKNIDDTYKK